MGLFDRFRKKKERLSKKSELKAVKSNDLTLAQLKSTAAKEQGQGKVESKAVKKVVKEDTKEAYRVLLKPLVTEKGTYLGATNKYLFAVAPKVNKIEVKKAIQALYGVMPLKVNIVNLSGKRIRLGRVQGVTKSKKKAIVTLKEGDKIEVYQGV